MQRRRVGCQAQRPRHAKVAPLTGSFRHIPLDLAISTVPLSQLCPPFRPDKVRVPFCKPQMLKFPLENRHVRGTTKQFFQTQPLWGQSRVIGRNCKQGTRVLVWEIKEPSGVALSLPVADLVARGCDLVESGRSEEPLAGSSWTRSGTSCTA